MRGSEPAGGNCAASGTRIVSVNLAIKQAIGEHGCGSCENHGDDDQGELAAETRPGDVRCAMWNSRHERRQQRKGHRKNAVGQFDVGSNQPKRRQGQLDSSSSGHDRTSLAGSVPAVAR